MLYSDQQTKPHLPARNVMKIISRKEKKELDMRNLIEEYRKMVKDIETIIKR